MPSRRVLRPFSRAVSTTVRAGTSAGLVENLPPSLASGASISLVDRSQILPSRFFPHPRNPPRGLPGQMSRRYPPGLHFGWRDTIP